MPIIYKGVKYSSKKYPILEYIFDKKTNDKTSGIGENHTFLLRDISEGYQACGIKEPASISNTILDLTRKNRGVSSRLPQSIIDLGYDLRKKTGADPNGENYAGEFVYVGVGKELQSWLVWPEEPDKQVTVKNKIPQEIISIISNDEGALFSVIDYCDALSYALYNTPNAIKRVQNPMKWQPNEIDGLYFSNHLGHNVLLPVEAKALSTADDINLEQMRGALETIHNKRPGSHVISLGVQMIQNGLRIAVFKETTSDQELEFSEYIEVFFDPAIPSWK